MTTTTPTECEVCPNTGNLSLFMGMWLCSSCKAKEIELQIESAKQSDARVAASKIAISEARAIDESITLKEDIFNANTVSIIDLKKAIDANPEIENKALALATELHTRFTHYQKVIFDARTALSEAGNASRAIQQYMNTLANQLRVEEREKLKLTDINYKPETPKTIKPSSGKTRGPKKGPSKEDYRNAAAKWNVPMEMIAAVAVAKNMTAEQAAEHVHNKLNPKTN